MLRRFALLSGFVSLALACAQARAQEPTDTEAWKARCLALNASAAEIDKGTASPQLLQTTHNIPGIQFATVAHERSSASQHYIACTLYYTAAMAERMGNGGKINPGRAHSYVVFGDVELKRATGQPLSFSEKMDTTGHAVTGVVKSGKLSPVEVAAVFAAFPNAPTDVAHPAPPPPKH